MGVVGRLDPQKGFDLVSWGAPGLIEAGARLVVLGTGDHTLVDGLRSLAAAHPDRVAILERFDRDEARRIYAGSDMFLMPSRFEPSGQGQLIAMRYGTVPVVRSTGGLVDTVIDADERPDDRQWLPVRPGRSGGPAGGRGARHGRIPRPISMGRHRGSGHACRPFLGWAGGTL